MLLLDTSGGCSRRTFLAAGSLALGGLTLPDLWQARAEAQTAGLPDFVRDKAVLFVFLSGGPSQYETLCPNMQAPDPYRSAVGQIGTTLPGLTIGSVFPLLAQRMHKLAAVRAFVPSKTLSEHGAATANLLTGGTRQEETSPAGFPLGSLVARLRGVSHPQTGMPSHVYFAGGSHASRHYRYFLNANRPGTLGPGYAPLFQEPRTILPRDDQSEPVAAPAANPLLSDMTPRLALPRIDDRLALLRQLDRMARRLDAREAAGYAGLADQALRVLRGQVAAAFDVDREPPQTLARYDTSALAVRLKEYEKDPRGYGYDPAIGNFGRYLLLARRLIEAGTRFLTVQVSGWDMHADFNNPNVFHGFTMIGPAFDRALSALLDDLDERGLSERVLVVVAGEFGRTGSPQGQGGRDHWAELAPLLLFGGGLKLGLVLGQIDRTASVATGEAVTLPQLCGTILHVLFDLGQLRLARGIPAEIERFVAGQAPVEALL